MGIHRVTRSREYAGSSYGTGRNLPALGEGVKQAGSAAIAQGSAGHATLTPDEQGRGNETHDGTPRQCRDVERHRPLAPVARTGPGPEQTVLQEIDAIGERVQVGQ